jgi:hypothetical protein
MYSKDGIHSFSGFFRVNTQSCSSKKCRPPLLFPRFDVRKGGGGKWEVRKVCRCCSFADIARGGEAERGFQQSETLFLGYCKLNESENEDSVTLGTGGGGGCSCKHREAKGRRELAQRGVLPSPAGGQGPGGGFCTVMDSPYTTCPDRRTACQAKGLLGCSLRQFHFCWYITKCILQKSHMADRVITLVDPRPRPGSKRPRMHSEAAQDLMCTKCTYITKSSCKIQ